MKFLDRIGLAKTIEIPTYSNAEDFERQLLNYKNSKKDKLGFLYASHIVPTDLKVDKHTFIVTKNPRIFWPLGTIGEIKGQLVSKGQNVIESRIFSAYWFLYFMIFMTFIIGLMGFIPFYWKGGLNFYFWLWFLGLQLFNVLTYFMLRNHRHRLEREFHEFLNEEILSKAP